MNVFRDPAASLLDRIHRLEKENARLRRRAQLRSRDRIFSIIRSISQLLAIFAIPAFAVAAVLFIGAIFCFVFASITSW